MATGVELCTSLLGFVPSLYKLWCLICVKPINSNCGRIIPKTKKKSDELKNYRPISLLNSDYKIISKTLANRLKKALPFIINIDQSFGIKGRSIHDNIIELQSLFNYIENKNLSAIFLNIDQEKAFDRVSHKFLFKVFQKFGFGTRFQNYIQIIHENEHET